MGNAGYTMIPVNYEFPRTEGKIFWISPAGARVQIAPTPTALGSANTISAAGAWTVTAGEAIGDLVYVSSAMAAMQADNTGAGTMPAFGIIVDKPTAVTATIVYNGEASVPGVFTPGDLFWVGVAGAVTFVKPVAGGLIAQPMGVAITAGSLLLFPGPAQLQ